MVDGGLFVVRGSKNCNDMPFSAMSLRRTSQGLVTESSCIWQGIALAPSLRHGRRRFIQEAQGLARSHDAGRGDLPSIKTFPSRWTIWSDRAAAARHHLGAIEHRWRRAPEEAESPSTSSGYCAWIPVGGGGATGDRVSTWLLHANWIREHSRTHCPCRSNA